MIKRSYTIRFYKATSGANNQGRTVESMFSELHGSATTRPIELAGNDFEVRSLYENRHGFRGVFAKVRKNDLPHAGAAGGGERELNLADDEGLLEKSHFFFAKRAQVLALQQNQLVGGATRFASYMGDAFSETVSFDPVLQREALRRLLSGNPNIRFFDVAIARPSTLILATRERLRHGWNRSMMEVMRNTGAYTLKMRVSGNGRAVGDDRFVGGDILQSIRELMNVAEVKRARVGIEVPGEEPGEVDLINDRIQASIEVEAVGRYPNSQGMWNELERAWLGNRDEILEVLGLEDARTR